MTFNRRKMVPFRELNVSLVVSFCLLAQLFSCFSKSTEEDTGHSETAVGRQSKNLFPFVWVTFQPSPCGTQNDGVCVQRGKCSKRGGTANGNCQDGFGECCTFTDTCNGTRTTVDVNQLVTVLTSPTPIDTPCTFRFKKEENICQVRLDFDSYQSAGADDDGMCVTDRLRIQNSLTLNNDFTTCGDLSGQHMYLTFGSHEYIEVSPLLKAVNPTSRYKIIATKIPCNSKNRAPDYCLQYFTKATGMVKSFDYPRQQQDNQMYTICVKPLSSSDYIEWKPCSGMVGGQGKPFDIITNLLTIPVECTTDWVQVKGEERRCEAFSATKSYWKPYELIVKFDGSELPPPPITFTKPVDPANCMAACTSMPGIYECECLDTAPNQTCQCVVEAQEFLNTVGDFNNTGFCLEYNQV